MKTEMDILRMDERQRLCWLLANRVTLFVVGIIWLGMIGWKLYHGLTPWFMIIAVPVFALIRLITYVIYSKKTLKSSLAHK